MIKTMLHGGGNPASVAYAASREGPGKSPIIVRRNAAIGDSLCATVVADKLMQQGYDVVWQTHPNIQCVIRRHPRIRRIADPGGMVHVNLDGAYENDPNRRRRHFHEMFMASANSQLSRYGIFLGDPRNCKPRLSVGWPTRKSIRDQFQNHPRPWVFINPRSESFRPRQVPDGIWEEAGSKIEGTKFWIGMHPGPKGMIDLKARHFDNVIEWLSVADLLITVDTGPMHVAAALGVPVVAISQSSSPELHLNDQNDFISIAPKLDCLNCQLNVCPKDADMPPCQQIDPALVASWANARLDGILGRGVSAIVSIYKPRPEKLNRCLEQVLPQVDEVIVVRDLAGKLPPEALAHPKIKYVLCPRNDIGYGRKVNFATRHSNGNLLLFLNDDCYLDPDAVAKMRAEMVEGVGMVAPLLRYPDGTIYHAGKVRSPGMMGWGHIDHRKFIATITKPTEMENLCGCCLLVRRRAFYEADCFDEDFYLYAEDDALCLSMRRAGYRLMFTPDATGIHDEGSSTKKTPNIVEIMNRSNALFGKKWGAYLRHNSQRIPGNFDYQNA